MDVLFSWQPQSAQGLQGLEPPLIYFCVLLKQWFSIFLYLPTGKKAKHFYRPVT